jgi:1-deoxy-D-xylulose-5-phosphate reductoisomerase
MNSPIHSNHEHLQKNLQSGSSKKNIALLGATGSIGTQTLDLIRSAPDSYSLKSLAAAGNNLEALLKIVEEFKPKVISVETAERAIEVTKLISYKCEVLHGTDGLNTIASDNETDTVVVAVVGAVGIEPTLTALQKAKRVIIANKETLVAAGDLIREALLKYGGILIPADSEHVALHQCLEGQKHNTVKKVYLTASGGPFYNSTVDFKTVTIEQALKHPTWRMGAKITIDSATMMNKGFEVIEAERLFGLSYDQIEVLIHPQSLVHSLAEFIDGNILAQLGPNDMRVALQYAIDYPERNTNLCGKFLNLKEAGKLEFFEPDLERFKCLKLAYEVGRLGKTYPAVLGAADEIAVKLFLNKQIKFSDIPVLIEKVLQEHKASEANSLNAVKEADQWARNKMNDLCLAVE